MMDKNKKCHKEQNKSIIKDNSLNMINIKNNNIQQMYHQIKTKSLDNLHQRLNDLLKENEVLKSSLSIFQAQTIEIVINQLANDINQQLLHNTNSNISSCISFINDIPKILRDY